MVSVNVQIISDKKLYPVKYGWYIYNNLLIKECVFLKNGHWN